MCTLHRTGYSDLACSEHEPRQPCTHGGWRHKKDGSRMATVSITMMTGIYLLWTCCAARQTAAAGLATSPPLFEGCCQQWAGRWDGYLPQPLRTRTPPVWPWWKLFDDGFSTAPMIRLVGNGHVFTPPCYTGHCLKWGPQLGDMDGGSALLCAVWPSWYTCADARRRGTAYDSLYGCSRRQCKLDFGVQNAGVRRGNLVWNTSLSTCTQMARAD